MIIHVFIDTDPPYHLSRLPGTIYAAESLYEQVPAFGHGRTPGEAVDDLVTKIGFTERNDEVPA